ncbi:MAG TPA: sensor histidine kinase [Natronosporangium sp.]
MSDWERRYQQLLVIVPWLLLVPSAVLSQLPTDQTGADRAITLGLVVLAGAWVYFGHTRVPAERRAQTMPMVVYFAGLIVLFAALMSRDTVFVLFTITGFFHAYELRPVPLGIAGIFSTSVVLNLMTLGWQDGSAQSIGTLVGIIAIQSAAISAGLVFSEKAALQHRQREAMVAKLEAALEENAGLHAQLLTQAREAGVLDERQRMAREIHDTLAQGLAGIITQLQAAQRGWHSAEQARGYVDRALALAKESLAEARRSVQALRPGELEDARLPDALSELARRWAADAGVDTHVEVTGDRVPLSPALEVALFRVAQEALTNVAKHAAASRVGLTLSYIGDAVLLDVRDDGRGMTNGHKPGFGLSSMRQRIRSVGGMLEIESTPGEGTAVSASVPAIVVGEK